LKHKISRVIVFDIDLHHGNGTQAIVWGVNEEAYRAETESQDAGEEQASQVAPELPQKKLKVYYGSLHDVMSFPCEVRSVLLRRERHLMKDVADQDGKLELIQAASTSLRGPHGQWIENIHLLPYENDEEFFEKLYPRYQQLIERASDFLEAEGQGEEVLVFISAGFDASLHEHPYMSRHGRKVPTSFYHRFTHDIAEFAAKHARSRVVSVLEGGYSSRALSSGAFAHVIGLSAIPPEKVQEEWWSLENLVKLEKATKPSARRTSASASAASEPWIERTLALLSELDTTPIKPPSSKRGTSVPIVPFGKMTLRERKPPTPVQSPQTLRKQQQQQTASASTSASKKPQSTARQSPPNRKEVSAGEGSLSSKHGVSGSPSVVVKPDPEDVTAPLAAPLSAGADQGEGLQPKTVKKVILHVNPPSQGGT